MIRRWPLLLIAAPAAVAVWSGWVGLGTMCGFGVIHPLPGIWDALRLNTAITLPIGVEAYGAYALGSWLTPGAPGRARTFARWSAIGSLALGMLGQVAYHLLAAAGAAVAPWPVVVLVSCLPVITLGMAAALTHLRRDVAADVTVDPVFATVPDAAAAVPGGVSIPALDDAAGTVATITADTVPTPPAPDTGETVARRARRRPVKVHTRRAERLYAGHLADGSLPSLRAVMRDVGVGQDRAREVLAHLASAASADGGETT